MGVIWTPRWSHAEEDSRNVLTETKDVSDMSTLDCTLQGDLPLSELAYKEMQQTSHATWVSRKCFIDEKAPFSGVREQGSCNQIISGVRKPNQARQVEPAQRRDKRFAGCCPHCFHYHAPSSIGWGRCMTCGSCRETLAGRPFSKVWNYSTCLHMGGHSSDYLAAPTRRTALLPLSVLSTTLWVWAKTRHGMHHVHLLGFQLNLQSFQKISNSRNYRTANPERRTSADCDVPKDELSSS